MDVPPLVSAWDALVLQLALAFTDATARTWQQIALGWVLHRGPATVTGILRALGRLADRHWTVYHKFFYRSTWSLQTLSAYLMARVIGPMILESGVLDGATGKPAVDLNIDDTTAGRYGKHVAHAGWFKDASATGPATKGTVIHWAHNWLVGAVTLRLPHHALLRWVLPAVFALYRKAADCDASHPFATRQVLAARMVCQVAAALPDMQIRVAADAGQVNPSPLAAGASAIRRLRRLPAYLEGPRRPSPAPCAGRVRCSAGRQESPPAYAAG